MSSEPRARDGDLRDGARAEPDWIERLRLAREQQTKDWGKRFVAGRASAGTATGPVEPLPGDPVPAPANDPDTSFFDQDAAPPLATTPPGRPSPKDDPFYDQDEEPWA